ncbi:MAG: CPBP family intramembrane metalloprotease [Candidatus Izimaplasma sp.]|nr:CPBP family intramembrane metalloprotease [Candidatus Izimaplasma bacterium]
MKRIVMFYLVAFIYSWGIWLIGIWLLPESIDSVLLVSIGGIGPFIAVIYYLVQKDTISIKGFLKRFYVTEKNSYLVLLFSFLLPLVVFLLAYVIHNIIYNQTLFLQLESEFKAQILISIIFLFFFGPLPEEIAWRGIAFNDLMKKNVWNAQFLVAILWAIWHIPLFFISNSYQAELGLFTNNGFLFFANTILLSVIIGWMYFLTKSILVAVVFHFMVNLTGEMFVVSIEITYIKTILYLLIAILSSVIFYIFDRNQQTNFK